MKIRTEREEKKEAWYNGQVDETFSQPSKRFFFFKLNGNSYITSFKRPQHSLSAFQIA